MLNEYKTEIAGVIFDTRMVRVVEVLVEATSLFNSIDGMFADGGGPFYGRAFYAADETLQEMGFSKGEADTIMMELVDGSIVLNSIERAVMARKDCDYPPYYAARAGNDTDCQSPEVE